MSASTDYLFRRGDAREIADVQREDYTRAIGERARCYPCRGVASVMTNEFTIYDLRCCVKHPSDLIKYTDTLTDTDLSKGEVAQ